MFSASEILEHDSRAYWKDVFCFAISLHSISKICFYEKDVAENDFKWSSLKKKYVVPSVFALAAWPGCIINVWHCEGLSMGLPQLKKP